MWNGEWDMEQGHLVQLPFSSEEYRGRLERVREAMARQGLDLIILSAPESVFYLTGFQTGTVYVFIQLLLPLKGPALWVVRKTEMSNVDALARVSWVTDGIGIDDSENPIAILAAAIRKLGYGAKVIGIERNGFYFTIDHYLRLQAELPQARFEDGAPIVEHLRAIKSLAELAYMRKAGRIGSDAMAETIGTLRAGVTDRELAATLISAAIRHGSDPLAAGPYVTTGKRTFLAHSSWIGCEVLDGDIVNTELAANVAHYNVPIFRVSAVGNPGTEIVRTHHASQAAMRVGLERYAPGMTFDEADRIVRAEIERWGYGDLFVVRAAYGIGLGFPPRWSESNVANIRRSDMRTLEAGMCFHLVPALYKAGVGAVCCSMPIEITANRCEPLATIEPRLFLT
jgi:Xaa-Pro dipeptidase